MSAESDYRVGRGGARLLGKSPVVVGVSKNSEFRIQCCCVVFIGHVSYRNTAFGFGDTAGGAPSSTPIEFFVCKAIVIEISNCEHFFTAGKVLHLLGA